MRQQLPGRPDQEVLAAVLEPMGTLGGAPLGLPFDRRPPGPMGGMGGSSSGMGAMMQDMMGPNFIGPNFGVWRRLQWRSN